LKAKLRPVEWPPLVTGRRGLPAWVLVRDTVITLVAWAVMAFLLRDLIRLAIDYFDYPFFRLTDVAPPDMALVWSKLRPYTEVIVFLMAWLLVSVLVLRRKARGRRIRPQPEALTIAEHADAFGLDRLTVSIWQHQRILVLRLSPEGHLESVQTVRAQQSDAQHT
jgi:poly-beta-1,6-N-acetyl-D-glucosamine biosynthesis protein PgaD